MIRRCQFLITAGSILGLPFLFSPHSLLTKAAEPQNTVPLTFEQFASSCIDLGSYAPRKRELTVHFTGRNPGRFYRYSNVKPEVWEKLLALNKSGGVGSYLNETIVQHPESFPFEVVRIQEFKISKAAQNERPKKQKAGDSK